MELPENFLTELLLRLAGVVITVIIGRALAGLTRRWMTRYLKKTTLTPSLINLFVTLAYYGILIITLMVALAVLGVPTTTIVGAAGIVVIVLAIALQQSLGNLAATINFLLFKPFEVGDIISSMGLLGVVSEIQMFSTVLDSPDNKVHVLPNGAILNGGLTNYSEKGSVRVDMKFRISYQSDVEKAKQVLEDILTGDPRVLAEPHPLVFVSGLEESHVEITAWPFVTISEFMLFNKDFAERVKQAFEEAGVVIPLPQQEVYLISDKGAG